MSENNDYIKGIINKLNIDHTKQPMFFGESLNLERYDRTRYKTNLEFFKEQISFFWRPEEIDLERETADWAKLSDPQKHIFIKNLSYQILLDSVQGRGIKHIIEHASNPEIEAFGSWWQSMEVMHSYSYSWLIMNLFSKPSDVFDEILNDQEIFEKSIFCY